MLLIYSNLSKLNSFAKSYDIDSITYLCNVDICTFYKSDISYAISKEYIDWKDMIDLQDIFKEIHIV